MEEDAEELYTPQDAPSFNDKAYVDANYPSDELSVSSGALAGITSAWREQYYVGGVGRGWPLRTATLAKALPPTYTRNLHTSCPLPPVAPSGQGPEPGQGTERRQRAHKATPLRAPSRAPADNNAGKVSPPRVHLVRSPAGSKDPPVRLVTGSCNSRSVVSACCLAVAAHLMAQVRRGDPPALARIKPGLRHARSTYSAFCSFPWDTYNTTLACKVHESMTTWHVHLHALPYGLPPP